MPLVADLVLVLAAAVIGGLIARRLGQPLIVGYIAAGVVVGPFTGGLTVSHLESVEQLAELGVALLLFSLGLEVSFRDLAPVRAVAFVGGAIQLVLTIAMGAALGRALRWPWPDAMWFGALISLSSTMVVLKTLQAQGRIGTLSSRVMLGLLVVQDLAVVPLMIVLPEFSRGGGSAIHVLVATGRAALLLAATILIATRIVPRLMAIIARWNSRELFVLTTVTVALGVGLAMWWSGLSLPLGAFIGGLVINESEYAHQALSDIVPLRDVFGMLFFVSVGMLLDPAVLWRQLTTLAVVVPIVMVGKGAIFAGVVRVFGYRRVVPLATGLTLFQVGEFAFVLAGVGLASHSMTREVYALALNTAIVTMALTPVVSGTTPWVYERVVSHSERETLEASNIPSTGLGNHVVIVGAGRIGRLVVDALIATNRSCVLIEMDDRRRQAVRAAGMPVIYGDASQAVVLEAAALQRARLLLITVPSYPDVRAIVTRARQLKSDISIIARAEAPDIVRGIHALGVASVTSPEFEGALQITQDALAYLGASDAEIRDALLGMRLRLQ